MSKLFESNRQVLTFPTIDSDAKIIYYAAPCIQFEQISLNLYKQYLKTALLSKKFIRAGLQKSLLKKSYELAVGA